MSAATRPGESAGSPQAAFPFHRIARRLVLGCALLAGCLWFAPVNAGALYRCTGTMGEKVFSSSTAGYTGCHRLASYNAHGSTVPARTRRTRDRIAVTGDGIPQAAAPAKVAFSGVRASVQTTARVVDPAASALGSHAGQWNYRESQAGPVARVASTAAGSRVLRGAVYRVVRRDGSVEYTNLRPRDSAGHAVTRLFSYIATCMACNLHSPIDWNSVRLDLTSYASAIRAASLQYGVNEAFLRAIIHAESAFNPRAMSLKGAQGLMQLMPGTASEMGVLDAFDADQNIRGGARYLARLLTTFHGDEQLAAAAYNAGPGAVQRYNGVPPYDETRVYVQRVGVLRRRYGDADRAPLADTRLSAVRAGGP